MTDQPCVFSSLLLPLYILGKKILDQPPPAGWLVVQQQEAAVPKPGVASTQVAIIPGAACSFFASSLVPSRKSGGKGRRAVVKLLPERQGPHCLNLPGALICAAKENFGPSALEVIVRTSGTTAERRVVLIFSSKNALISFRYYRRLHLPIFSPLSGRTAVLQNHDDDDDDDDESDEGDDADDNYLRLLQRPRKLPS